MIPFICVNKLAEKKKSSCEDLKIYNSFHHFILENVG